jgi:formylglycine-generating enzyme required for sulfatase activity
VSGLCDMAGNVEEFTLGFMADDALSYTAVKGGSFRGGSQLLSADSRLKRDGEADVDLGFRCARVAHSSRRSRSP